MKGIKIETAKESDSEGLTRLFRKLYEGDEDKKFYSSKASPSNVRLGSKVFVARENKRLVGFCWAIWYEHIKNKGVGIIEELYVDEGYRRKGIGKRLVEAALKFMSKKVIVVFVTTDNQLKDAQKFYESIGFKLSHEPWYVIKPKGKKSK
jgi:ribosomal protein S18 acetylase RimI-like enzyme